MAVCVLLSNPPFKTEVLALHTDAHTYTYTQAHKIRGQGEMED